MIWLKHKIYVIGAALLAVGAFVTRLLYVQNQLEKTKEERDSLESTLRLKKKKEEIVKKNDDSLIKELKKIEEEVKKDDKDFEGLDNLSNPNDY